MDIVVVQMKLQLGLVFQELVFETMLSCYPRNKSSLWNQTLGWLLLETGLRQLLL